MKYVMAVMAFVLLLFAYPIEISAEALNLANGRYEKWYDRIENMPEYADLFYEWLENNCGQNDILADVTKAQYVNGSYVYEIASITDTIHMSIAGVKNVSDAVYDKLEQVTGDTFAEMCPYIFAAYNTFLRDHPEVFWLSDESWTSYTCTRTYDIDYDDCIITYTQKIYFDLKTDSFDIRSSNYPDKEAVVADITNKELWMESVLSQCDAFDRYGQIKYLNKWLTEHNSYNTLKDVSAADKSCRECISALEGRTGEEGPVCSGYSRAFKVLCDRLQIPCVLVDGSAFTQDGEEFHEWNYVQMEDGMWYAVDVTWNDPIILGRTSEISGGENEKYLLVGENTIIDGMSFGESHRVTNVIDDGTDLWNGPALERERYKKNGSKCFCGYTGYTLAKTGSLYYFKNGKLQACYQNHVALK